MHRSFAWRVALRVAVGLLVAALLWHWVTSPWQQALLGLLIAGAVAWSSARALGSALISLERSLRAKSLDPARDDLSESTPLREFTPLLRTVGELCTAANVRLERSLEERRELERMLDSMPEAIAAVDAGGRLQWINGTMRSLLPQSATGTDHAELTARLGQKLVHIIRDPDVLASVDGALAGETVAERRARTVLPARTFEVNAVPMPEGGAVVILRDVTPAEQMERTQRDFVANVSHELRTPLTSITGYVETLLEEAEEQAAEAEAARLEAASVADILASEAGQNDAGSWPGETTGSPAVEREFLATVLRNAERMNRLIDDLLELSRVESGEHPVRPAPVPASVLVDEALASVSGMLPEDNTVQLVRGGVSHGTVLADSDATFRVLTNLLENALKYGKGSDGTRVEISVAPADDRVPSTSPVPAEAALCFTVRDSGPGIASEHLVRLFERFYRVDKARSRDSGGTGLGLAIARGLVQAQGGAIWCESEVGRGSAFRFLLPLAEAPPLPAPNAPSESTENPESLKEAAPGVIPEGNIASHP